MKSSYNIAIIICPLFVPNRHPIMKVMGTTNVISISDTIIKAMAVADNCTCGWGTRTKIIILTEGWLHNYYYHRNESTHIRLTNILSSVEQVDTGHMKGQNLMLPLTGSVPVVLSLSRSKASTSL